MNNRKPLVYSTILLAVMGDIEAINAILKYYRTYILTLSQRTFFDDEGNQRTIIDEDLRNRIETKLIIKILTFDVA